MKAPITLKAICENGSIIERTYHVGGIARMVSNLERIAPEYTDSPIARIEIAPATGAEIARSLRAQYARIAADDWNDTEEIEAFNGEPETCAECGAPMRSAGESCQHGIGLNDHCTHCAHASLETQDDSDQRDYAEERYNSNPLNFI